MSLGWLSLSVGKARKIDGYRKESDFLIQSITSFIVDTIQHKGYYSGHYEQ
jgi:hypothetical protein